MTASISSELSPARQRSRSSSHIFNKIFRGQSLSLTLSLARARVLSLARAHFLFSPFSPSISTSKVELVIGKGGETIKQLQEQEGVKLFVDLDPNIASYRVTISGEAQKCQVRACV